MFKQILSKIPRKSSKSSEHQDHRGVSTAGSNASTSVKKLDPSSKRYGKPNHAHGPGSNGSPNAFQNQASISSKDVDSKIKGILVSSYEALRSFREVPSSEKQNLFIRKLIMCCVVFDFTDPTKNLKEKEIKRQTLLELVDYVSSANGKFSETSMQEVVKMVSSNLFRSLCAQSRENKVTVAFDVEDDEPLMDPSWPHLQIVYELMLRFVASPETDAKLAKRFIDHSFVLKLALYFFRDMLMLCKMLFFGKRSMNGGRILQLLRSGYQGYHRHCTHYWWLSAKSTSSSNLMSTFEEKYLAHRSQTSVNHPYGYHNLVTGVQAGAYCCRVGT